MEEKAKRRALTDKKIAKAKEASRKASTTKKPKPLLAAAIMARAACRVHAAMRPR
jgi:hypothetical protein